MTSPSLVSSFVALSTALLVSACSSEPAETTTSVTATETGSGGEGTSGAEPTSTTSTSTTAPTTGATTTTTSTTGGPTTGETTTPTSGVSGSTDGETTEPPPGCDDGAQNGDETDVDCGGSCPGCPLGGACVVPGDCADGPCLDGLCAAPMCSSDDECGGGDACNAPRCDPDTGTCGVAPLPDRTPCDDGLLCTSTPGSCLGGACVPGTVAPVSLAALPPGAGFVIDGEFVDNLVGYEVRGIGDVNGDGLADLAMGVGQTGAFPAGEKGRIYVVFGKQDAAPVALADITAEQGGGFIIRANPDARLSYYFDGVGDVNGDGLADLVVASPSAKDLGDAVPGSGRAFVVFGKADAAAVDLAQVLQGVGGFAIAGETGTGLGYGVGGPGDVDGDGRDDILIGEPQYAPNSTKGRVLVVFGGDAQPPRTAGAIAAGQGGFAIVGAAVGDYVGSHALRGAGDVDGDGHADMLIGAVSIPGPAVGSGRLYFIRGKADGATIDLAAVAAGQGGYVVGGDGAHAWLGQDAADLGDVDGDGLRDFVVTAPYWFNMAVAPGRAYVVFGKLDGAPVDVNDIAAGIGGYAVSSSVVGDGFGYRADALGDLDGDGRVDFAVGAIRTMYTQLNAGRLSVVLSAAQPESIAADDLVAGMGGFVVDGAAPGDSAWHVAGAGDVNGDGIPDIAVGADAKFKDAGRVYVLFGPVCASP